MYSYTVNGHKNTMNKSVNLENRFYFYYLDSSHDSNCSSTLLNWYSFNLKQHGLLTCALSELDEDHYLDFIQESASAAAFMHFYIRLQSHHQNAPCPICNSLIPSTPSNPPTPLQS